MDLGPCNPSCNRIEENHTRKLAPLLAFLRSARICGVDYYTWVTLIAVSITGFCTGLDPNVTAFLVLVAGRKHQTLKGFLLLRERVGLIVVVLKVRGI